MANPTANVRVFGSTVPVYGKAGQMLKDPHYLAIDRIEADVVSEDGEVWVYFPLDNSTGEEASAFDVLFSRGDLGDLIARLERVLTEAWAEACEYAGHDPHSTDEADGVRDGGAAHVWITTCRRCGIELRESEPDEDGNVVWEAV